MVENSRLFAQRAHSARCAPPDIIARLLCPALPTQHCASEVPSVAGYVGKVLLNEPGPSGLAAEHASAKADNMTTGNQKIAFSASALGTQMSANATKYDNRTAERNTSERDNGLRHPNSAESLNAPGYRGIALAAHKPGKKHRAEAQYHGAGLDAQYTGGASKQGPSNKAGVQNTNHHYSSHTEITLYKGRLKWQDICCNQR